jgi:hypothetical protein
VIKQQHQGADASRYQLQCMQTICCHIESKFNANPAAGKAYIVTKDLQIAAHMLQVMNTPNCQPPLPPMPSHIPSSTVA